MSRDPQPHRPRRSGRARFVLVALGIVAGVAAAVWFRPRPASPHPASAVAGAISSDRSTTATPKSPAPPPLPATPQAVPTPPPAPGTINYHAHIEPIVRHHCVPCHRPGEAAPFALLDYAEVRKRATQIADMTGRRLMPPWMPAPGPYAFMGDRSLTEEQIASINRWAMDGAPEGTGSGTTNAPTWKEGWHLGQPDLVVTMTEAFIVPAEGEDVYRNFVLPIHTTERKYVRAVELNPGNRKVLHHAFMLIDPTPESRRADARAPGPGFDGLHTPRTAQPPEGHFLSWQPGKRPEPVPPGMAWVLEKDSDLVLQVHLRPGGRPEYLQASVGLYFTPEPPRRTPFKVGLRSFTIDIPAGATNHWVHEEWPVPVDLDVYSILPHAHYLGQEMHAVARLTDGRELPLLSIPRWDFNWQGEYTYRDPVFVPKGAVLAFRYRFDNSTNNVANPANPPRRVGYGLNAEDEMAELWLQVLPRNPADRTALAEGYRPRLMAEALLYNRYLLERNPDDARALTEIAKVHLAGNRTGEALPLLQKARSVAPNDDEAAYFLGLTLRMQGDAAGAREAFRDTVRLNPGHARAHGNLGLVSLQLDAREEAIRAFQSALRLNPEDAIARRNLEALGVPQSNSPGGSPLSPSP